MFVRSKIVMARLLVCSVFAGGFSLATQPAYSAPIALKYGRWAGTFRPTHVSLPMGVTFDLFISQPNDVTAFPRLEAIFKVSLGGIQGSESYAVHFKNVLYNYETGDLTFDEGDSEFLVEAKVVEAKKIQGRVTSVATGISGTLELVFVDKEESTEPCDPDEPCEPQEDPTARIPRGSYLPTLGQVYTGTCAGDAARMEISTARMADSSSSEQELLKGFEVYARLGTSSQTCAGGTQGTMCVLRAWNSAQFDFFRSRLTLSSNQFSDECKLTADGNLNCEISTNNETKSCSLSKTNSSDFNFSASEKNFKLTPTADERKPLPQDQASLQTLKANLSGTFSGYLFHENSGKYQPMQVGVTATISTDNPHNEPFVYVSGQTRLYLGADLLSLFANSRFDRRTFFASQGFTLSSETSDVFLVIESWTTGFISGSAYSEHFGRIGSFELKKGTTLPALPASEKNQISIVGAYQGVPRAGAYPWKLDFRTSELGSMNGLVPLVGTAQIVANGQPIPRFGIQRGSYDLFTGKLSLEIKESEAAQRLVFGYFSQQGNLLLRFGSSSGFGTLMSNTTQNAFTRLRP